MLFTLSHVLNTTIQVGYKYTDAVFLQDAVTVLPEASNSCLHFRLYNRIRVRVRFDVLRVLLMTIQQPEH
jgi:hypothetical protein